MQLTLAFLLSTFLYPGCDQSPTPKNKNRIVPSTSANSRSDPARVVQHFSDTKELVLSMDSMKFMLDLDTGKTMDPPATRRREQAQMDVHSNQVQPYQRPAGLVGISTRGKKVKSIDWDATVSDVHALLASDKVDALAQMNYEPAKPATYFFRTRGGTEGVLQLLAIVDEPKGIRIRYKTLVRPSP